MNPYDFVPIDEAHRPELRRPVWHHVLVPDSTHPARLYSGHLYIDIKTETPLFIGTDLSGRDPRQLKEHIRNKADQYIIPGTSIKGLLRSVVETLCNGCLVVYSDRHYPAPAGFAACQDNTQLCIACRLFGMMARRRNPPVFLGKVSPEDALAYENDLAFHEPIYTAVLDNPKPQHRAFYLNARRVIAGRKFYFHQNKLQILDRLLPRRDKPDQYRNQYIKPIKTDSWFYGRINFRNLEADELAALLFALTLEPDMRHKIGYGKPIGLGSIWINVTDLTLVDYATRYTNARTDPNHGITTYNRDQVKALIEEQMASLDTEVHAAWQRLRSQPALSHLRRIWEWEPDPTVEYFYPEKAWFDAHPTAPIVATRHLRARH
jgi:hypothetical protein